MKYDFDIVLIWVTRIFAWFCAVVVCSATLWLVSAIYWSDIVGGLMATFLIVVFSLLGVQTSGESLDALIRYRLEEASETSAIEKSKETSKKVARIMHSVQMWD